LGKQYFVAVILEDGTPATFFSPGQKLNDNVVHQFFNPRKFQEVAGQLDLGEDPQGTPFDMLGGRTGRLTGVLRQSRASR
jgi:hypothetical protein